MLTSVEHNNRLQAVKRSSYEQSQTVCESCGSSTVSVKTQLPSCGEHRLSRCRSRRVHTAALSGCTPQ